MQAEVIKNLVQYLRKGILTFYKQEQRLNFKTNKYEGKGIIQIIVDDTTVEMTIMDEYLETIITNNISGFVRISNKIIRIIRKLEVRFRRYMYKQSDIKDSKQQRFDQVYMDSSGMIIRRPHSNCIPILPEPDLVKFSFDSEIRRKIIWGKGIKLYQTINEKKLTIAYLPAFNSKEDFSTIDIFNGELNGFSTLSKRYIRGERVSYVELKSLVEQLAGEYVQNSIEKLLSDKESQCIMKNSKQKFEDEMVILNDENAKNVDPFWTLIDEQKKILKKELTISIQAKNYSLAEKSMIKRRIKAKIGLLNERFSNFKVNLRDYLLSGTIKYTYDGPLQTHLPIKKWIFFNWIKRIFMENIASSVGVDSGNFTKQNMNYTKLRLAYDSMIVKSKREISKKMEEVIEKTKQIKDEREREKVIRAVEEDSKRKFRMRKVGEVENSLYQACLAILDKYEPSFITSSENREVDVRILDTNWSDQVDREYVYDEDTDEEMENFVMDESQVELENNNEDFIIECSTEKDILTIFKRVVSDDGLSVEKMRKMVEASFSMSYIFINACEGLPTFDPQNDKVVIAYFNKLLDFLDNDKEEDNKENMMQLALQYSEEYYPDSDDDDKTDIITGEITLDFLTSIGINEINEMITDLPEVDKDFIHDLIVEREKPIYLTESKSPECFRNFLDKENFRSIDKNQLISILNEERCEFNNFEQAELALITGKTVYYPINRNEEKKIKDKPEEFDQF
jgi:hypothetical protein